VSRQRLPADWRKRLQLIHGAAAEAQRTLAPSISSQLPAQPGAAAAGPDAPQLDYFRAREVRYPCGVTALAAAPHCTVLCEVIGEPIKRLA
jgi:hypothetical protein